MLFKKKRINEFKDMLKASFEDISNHDFDKVLKIYSKLLAKYNLLSSDDKKEINESYERLVLELRVYMHIKEAEVLLNFNDFGKIKEKLNLIKSLSSSLKLDKEDAKETSLFAQKIYQELFSLYNKNYSTHQFNSLYLQIFKHIKHKEIKRAIQEYHSILNHYKELLKYEPVEKFKPKLDKIIQSLEELSTFKKAYEPVQERIIKIEIPEYAEITHRELPPTPTQDFSKDFNKIHELLEKNKLSEAEKLYQNL